MKKIKYNYKGLLLKMSKYNVMLTRDALYSLFVTLKQERKLKHFSKNNRSLVNDVELLRKMRIKTDMAVCMMAYDYIMTYCDINKYYLRSFDYDIIHLLADVGGGIVTTNYIYKLFKFYSRLSLTESELNSFNAKILLLMEIPSTDFNILVYYSMLYKRYDTLEMLYKYYQTQLSVRNLKDAILIGDLKSLKTIFYKVCPSYSELVELVKMVEEDIENCKNDGRNPEKMTIICEFLKVYIEQ